MSFRANIMVDAYVDVQEAYDDLDTKDRREFLLKNIDGLSDNDLISELTERGYTVAD